MDVSFSILTWNSEAYVEKCLQSIANALTGSGLTYEVLVLDNGSHDGTPALLARLAAQDPEHVFPHYRSTNLGTTRSRNALFKVARGEFLCVMDSDVEIAPGVIEHLIPYLRKDSQVGLVAPRIFYPSGAWQKSFDRFPTLLDKVNRFVRLRAIEQQEGEALRNETAPFEIDYAISAFWLMRRSLLSSVGMLDEEIFYAPEDVDFCLRIWRSGKSCLYVPAVSIVHHTQEISRGIKLNRAKLAHIRGLAYYFMKHRYLLRRPAFAPKSVA